MSDGAVDVAGLIARCLGSDDAAKAEFINTYAEFIRRAVARKLATMSPHAPVRQDVEDIANEVVVRLLERDCAPLASIREHRSIHAWLLVVSGNFTVDYVRKWGTRMQAQGLAAREASPAYDVTPRQQLEEEETRHALAALVGSLPLRERLVLELYYSHGKKYAEIAGITGQNINTVATNIKRARERLRKILADAANMEGAINVRE